MAVRLWRTGLLRPQREHWQATGLLGPDLRRPVATGFNLDLERELAAAMPGGKPLTP
jgi:hypothetical protein